MNLDLPQHLHSTRDLLMVSMQKPSIEQPPALPKGLLEDLTSTLTHQAAPSNQGQFAGFLATVRSMLATPAFGSLAAAIAILAVASSVVLSPDSSPQKDTFRGASTFSVTESVQVILVGAPRGTQRTLESANDFEAGIFTASSNSESAMGIEGPRVIVDFQAKTIIAINADGDIVNQAELPASSNGISLEISSALIRL